MDNLDFRQKIILALIAGFFAVLAALATGSGNSQSSYQSISTNNITNSAVANGGNAVAITGGGNVNINQTSNNNVQIDQN